MKYFLLLFLFPGGFYIQAQETPKNNVMNFHDFKVESITGEEFDFSSLKGKKVMVVNTASECGLTPQYAQLQELYDEFGDKGFVIIGFPANDFGNQEPGSDEEIAQFCQSNFSVTFPMMSKISVKGEEIHPVYQWLTEKEKNGVSDSEVTWNFQKFLVDEEGNWVKSIPPRTEPLSEEIIDWITN